jgi:hypothetical protein
MSNRFAYPAEKTYTTLWNMANPDHGLLLGLGRTNSWALETSPPDVDPLATGQEQLACYFPIVTRKVAKRVSSGGTEFGGQFFTISEAATLDTIRAAQATHLYIEAVVDHNLMPNNSFRSLGLYRFIEYAEGIDAAAPVFLPGDVNASLYFLEHIEPVVKTSNLLQTFKIIVKG